MYFEINPNVLQTPYNQSWEICAQDVGYIEKTFLAQASLFCLAWSSGTQAELYRYNNVDSWISVSSIITFSGYHSATTLVVNDEIYIFSYGILKKWNNSNSVSTVAYAPSGTFTSVNFFGALEGNIYFSKYGTVYRWNNSNAWVKIVNMYAGGMQQWTSHPDSVSSQAIFRYQLIFSDVTQDWQTPGDLLAISLYPMYVKDDFLGPAVVASGTTYIYRLIDGVWTYSRTVIANYELYLLGPILPPPVEDYIIECNHDIYSALSPFNVRKYKTTTIAQDNLPDTNVWSNLGMKDSVLYVCNNDGYMRSCNPSVSSVWAKLTLGTFLSGIITYDNNIYTIDYGYLQYGTFIYTTSWNKINTLSIFGDYVIKGTNAYFAYTIYSSSHFYSNIFSANPTLLCQDDVLEYGSSFYYLGDTWYFVCYNLLYALLSGNVVMITGLPDIVAIETLHSLFSIGNNLYVMSRATDLLYKLSQPTYSINRINI